MHRTIQSLTFCVVCVAACLGVVSGAGAWELPSPWQHQDIGAVEVTGNASAADGVFTLKGTLDIWGASDGCHFAWQPLKGDCQIVARVLSIEQTQNHAKGGVAIRESLAADARHATMVDTPVDGTQFLVREQAGSKTTVQRTNLNRETMPYWVKLVRAGDQLTGYESLDGQKWVQTGAVTLKLPETVYVGLVASSHLKDKLCSASFDKVSITATAK